MKSNASRQPPLNWVNASRGEEFAVKHLGTEDEMQQVLRTVVESLPPGG